MHNIQEERDCWCNSCEQVYFCDGNLGCPVCGGFLVKEGLADWYTDHIVKSPRWDIDETGTLKLYKENDIFRAWIGCGERCSSCKYSNDDDACPYSEKNCSLTQYVSCVFPVRCYDFRCGVCRFFEPCDYRKKRYRPFEPVREEWMKYWSGEFVIWNNNGMVSSHRTRRAYLNFLPDKNRKVSYSMKNIDYFNCTGRLFEMVIDNPHFSFKRPYSDKNWSFKKEKVDLVIELGGSLMLEQK